MKHLGDITKVDWSKVALPDCVCGGSPCQDLSTAGLRKGLAGSRSGLFYEQIRCIKEIRDESRRRLQANVDRGLSGRFLLWENVPGATSSGTPQGEDFRIVIEEAIKVIKADVSIPRPEKWANAGCVMGDGFSLAWRVHDAQYFGVPQRRRRLCLLCDYEGYEAPWILFDPQLQRTSEDGCPIKTDGSLGGEPGRVLQPQSSRLSGNPQPSAEEGETASSCTGGRIGQTVAIEGNGYRDSHHGDGYTEGDVSFTLNTVEQHGVAYTLKIRGGAEVDSSGRKAGKGALVQEELSGTLGVSQDQTLITIGTAVGFDGYNQSVTGDKSKPLTNAATDSDHVPCVMKVIDSKPMCYQKTIGPLVATDYKGIRNESIDEDKAIIQRQTLAFSPAQTDDPCDKPPVVIEMTSTKNTIVEDGVMPTLTARMGTGGNQVNAVCASYQEKTGPLLRSGYEKLGVQEATSDMYIVQSVVRRLTPTECERLQDFPDGWTDLGDWLDSKGKKRKASLAPRYRALGNSIALPFWRWVMRRISACYDRTATLGSLFDGIGGFPLCWTLANGPGSVLWASEIEEFPIAVTTKHFGDEDKGIEGDLWQVLAEQERKRK